MIRCNFDRLRLRKALDENRDISLRQVQRETGLSLGTILRLNEDFPDRVDLKTIDVLCQYFACEVEQILEYTASANTNGTIQAILEREGHTGMFSSKELAGIIALLDHEGLLLITSQDEILNFYTEDALILQMAKRWEHHAGVLEYYAQVYGTEYQNYEYHHNILSLRRLAANPSLVGIMSQTVYRPKAGATEGKHWWEVWKLMPSQAHLVAVDQGVGKSSIGWRNATGWRIAEFHGGLDEAAAREKFNALIEHR